MINSNNDKKLKIKETNNSEEILSFALANGVEHNQDNDRYMNQPYFGIELFYDNKLIGTAIICKSKFGDYTLENLAILEQFRHKGYATMLIEYILNKAKILYIDKIYLIAHVYEIYEQLGFRFTDDKSYLINDICLDCELYKSRECIPKIMFKDI